VEREGFYAPLASAQALAVGGFRAIGNANNVNYGAEPITRRCDKLATKLAISGGELIVWRKP
jgi:hypothetical protein